jgi:hypothetical protein
MNKYPTVTCHLCGKTEECMWPSAQKRMMDEKICFSCHHWLELYDKRDDNFVIVDKCEGVRHHFIIVPLPANWKTLHPSFRMARLGYGGSEFNIRFIDGRQENHVSTINLWCQGEIPKHLYDKFPVNAEFINI